MFFKKLKGIDKNKPQTQTKTASNVQGPSSSGSSTQAWLPVKDVYNGFIHRKDGTLIAAVRVQPVNFQLLSENEKLRKIKALQEVLNGIDYPFQTFSIGRPVDLDAYIADLEELKNQTSHRIRARLLSGYMKQAAALAISGEALDRQFYILLSMPKSKNSQQDEAVLQRKAVELAASLSGADLISHVCTDEELRDLLFIFTNPNQAAYERAPVTSMVLPTVFIEGA